MQKVHESASRRSSTLPSSSSNWGPRGVRRVSLARRDSCCASQNQPTFPCRRPGELVGAERSFPPSSLLTARPQSDVSSGLALLLVGRHSSHRTSGHHGHETRCLLGGFNFHLRIRIVLPGREQQSASTSGESKVSLTPKVGCSSGQQL